MSNERVPKTSVNRRPVLSTDQVSMLPTELQPELLGVKPLTATKGKFTGLLY